MNRLGAVLAVVFALVLALASGQGAFADPKFPTLTGRVVDEAHVLSPDTQTKLTSELAALEAKNGDQLVVVTLPDLQGYPIEDFGYQLLRTWGIGQKGKDNGAIFIVVPSEHKVRIEVGYGLEPVLTDGLSSIILQRSVLPRFRSGDIEGGVVAGTESLVQQLGLSPEEAQARAQEAQQAVIERPARRHGSPLQGLIVIIFIVLFISSMLRGRGGGWWFLPFLFMGGGGRYRGDDGFGGGGFGGGGGFSGGGGSGGGGGASGSW